MTASKKILIVPVNYNSYDYLDSYLKSVSEAWDMAKNECELTVYIADNSTKPEDVDLPQYNLPDLKIKRLDNLGYFGGALYVINNCVNVADYDYVIISNVDITLDLSFFAELSNLQSDNNVGWIAPMIYSSDENRDRNPKIIARPSKKRLSLLKTMYQFPFLHSIYTKTFYKRKKLLHYAPRDIYAGHGSVVILTKNFFNKYPRIEYPIFLFGEEIFLGELCRKAQLSTIYRPSIKVLDSEHASTSQMKSAFYYKCNYDALSYILKEFYE